MIVTTCVSTSTFINVNAAGELTSVTGRTWSDFFRILGDNGAIITTRNIGTFFVITTWSVVTFVDISTNGTSETWIAPTVKAAFGIKLTVLGIIDFISISIFNVNVNGSFGF